MKREFLPTDVNLIVAIQSGDTAAFQTLYRTYWRPLFNFACQATRDVDEAKDLLQDLFADIWQNRATIRADTFSSAYLYATLRHKLLDRIRRGSVRFEYAQHIAATTNDADHSTEATILASDFSERLQHELNELPDRCRLIFQLSRFDDQSVDEIASHLSLSPQTVKNQLTTALRRLRTGLYEYATFVSLLIVSALA
ncbi:RNA polymerase, sigma-24 subunit, ECF subfamily [Fibrella aestuarina BUZ 2]|uniref:RNA polymerase, sigma-24 subunit, ECF subfamily n=1 Tax=Fibrella aestuarina BUZ 2 TaxID=1166018 RepID=I0K8B4_9BACT|nr:RNA polymerase sigma-70 factor [Fibrella aestuarina]CCH00367.1 RNA polymerase, sigma-24 subunit, ECF subfamily [Fibrella aestuarina BUZ 2]